MIFAQNQPKSIHSGFYSPVSRPFKRASPLRIKPRALLLVLLFVGIVYHAFFDPEKDSDLNPTPIDLSQSSSSSSLNASPKLSSTPDAIIYSPLTISGTCKPLRNIIKDLHNIHIHHNIPKLRLYSSDCGVLDAHTPKTKGAKALFRVSKLSLDHFAKLKLIIGLHPSFDEDSHNKGSASPFAASLDSQIADLVSWNNWPSIALLVVGSSGVDDVYSRSDLVQMLRHVRTSLHAYAIPRSHQPPLTVSEPVQAYISASRYTAPPPQSLAAAASYEVNARTQTKGNSNGSNDDDDLCAAVDVIGLAIMPFFNAAIAPDSAGELVQRDIRFARFLCSPEFIGARHGSSSLFEHSSNYNTVDYNGNSIDVNSFTKEINVLEAGWPSQGLANGEAVAGVAEQVDALNAVMAGAKDPRGQRVSVTLYSYENERWREPGELKVETEFGVSHALP